jgi:hypothetical protein
MMKSRAAAELQEQVIEATKIFPRGYILRRWQWGKQSTLVEEVLDKVSHGRVVSRDPSTTPAGYRDRMYMVLTPTRLVFFTTGFGWVREKLDRQLVRARREAVADFVVGAGRVACPVTITLVDGRTYRLEVSWRRRRNALRIQNLLQQHAAEHMEA